MLLLTAVAAAAEPDAGLRGQVEGLLGSYGTVRAERWRALGPDAAPILASVVTDATALPTFRARALAALGSGRSGAGGAPRSPPAGRPLRARSPLRSSAIGAAPSVLGESAAAPLLQPLLSGDDPTLTTVSARSLARAGTAGCAMVRAEARRRPERVNVARSAAACEARLGETPKPAH